MAKMNGKAHRTHYNLLGINESNDDADGDDDDDDNNDIKTQYNQSVPLVRYPLLTDDFVFFSLHTSEKK